MKRTSSALSLALCLGPLLVACDEPPRPAVPPAAPAAPAAPAPPLTNPPTVSQAPAAPAAATPVSAAVRDAAVSALVKQHGEAARERARRGVDQIAVLWRPEDGDLAAFASAQFLPEGAKLDATFDRLEAAMEQLDGHTLEISRELRRPTETDIGPLLPVDPLLGAVDPSAHLVEDLFQSKIAFVTLLNFPLTTLKERIAGGKDYTRRRWAEVRLTGRFARRVPGEVQARITKEMADSSLYIADYNIWMHHLLDEAGGRPFPKGLRLISHWNLRDELKAAYADDKGLLRQQMIAKLMERIVTQTIPRAIIDNPRLDWNPMTNAVTVAPAAEVEDNAPAAKDPAAAPAKAAAPDPVVAPAAAPAKAAAPDPAAAPAKDPAAAPAKDPAAAPPAAAAAAAAAADREPDTRYARLLANFRAHRAADPYSPTAPTLIARMFELSHGFESFSPREMPEERVRALLTEICASPLAAQVGAEIERRLSRKLLPHDLWYNGFQARGKISEKDLDAATQKKYPNKAAFQADLPNILGKLGFARDKARFLSEHIVVDASRGAGHAMQAARRGDFPHLRTRVGPRGMDYKGYNIAVHELGHNVEQVFSLYEVDHTLLSGVPNNAFTEALAFVFQARDLELLGLSKPDPSAERARVLSDFWATWEIAGVGLVDMQTWHWMYDHPDATPEQLRQEVVRISGELWNRYYAPILGGKDTVLLGIYSHMIQETLYLPDYPLGHLIAFQIEEHLRKQKKGSLGAEFERMSRFGAVLPDLWMENATGAPISAAPLLRATEAALKPAE